MSRANQKMLKFEFEALQSGLREVVWLHITVEAYFHMNWASHNDNIPKAYDQWPGFAYSYSHSVLKAEIDWMNSHLELVPLLFLRLNKIIDNNKALIFDIVFGNGTGSNFATFWQRL